MPDHDEPTQTTDKGLEIAVPTRKAWDDMLGQLIKPAESPQDPADDAEDQEGQ